MVYPGGGSELDYVSRSVALKSLGRDRRLHRGDNKSTVVPVERGDDVTAYFAKLEPVVWPMFARRLESRLPARGPRHPRLTAFPTGIRALWPRPDHWTRCCPQRC